MIGVAVVVKYLLGKHVKKQGEKVGSFALIASGSDALFDSLLSLSVFVAAIVYLNFGLAFEAYLGIVISVFMIKAGIEMMLETVDDLTGHRANKDIVEKIKIIIKQEYSVIGFYDLATFNYEPNKYYVSAHVELPDTMTIDEVDELTRRLQYKIYKKYGIILIALGVYSFNTKDKEAREIRKNIERQVLSHDWALQVHVFHIDTEIKTIRFDVVMSFDIDYEEGIKNKKRGCCRMNKSYHYR